MPAGRARRSSALHAAPGLALLPDPVLLDGLAALAGAESVLDVVDATCRVLVGVDGLRAAAVVQRHSGAAVVLGSSGYGCDAMGPGARLPLDSGLPVVEAIRTGQVVRQGTGPGWCAVPFGRRTATPGALLLSLTVAPPEDEDDVLRLQRLAHAVGLALTRAARQEQSAADLGALISGLTAPSSPDSADLAIRQRPLGGTIGGDVLLALPDDRGGRWLVSADVCGCGLPASTGAAAVRTAVRALAPIATGPAQLLSLLDAALRPEAPDGSFITAAAVHVRGNRIRAASAGHPVPLLLTAYGAVELAVQPGAPLTLETAEGPLALPELDAAAPAGALLVLYSDGLLDRRGPGGGELDVTALLEAAAGQLRSGPAAVADAVLAAAEAAGPAEDDVSVLVSRL